MSRQPHLTYTGQSGVLLAREAHTHINKKGNPDFLIGGLDAQASALAKAQIERVKGLTAVYHGTTLVVQQSPS